MTFIVLESIPYEGLGLVSEPTVVHPTRDAAVGYAKQHGLISPKGRRNDAEIIEVLTPSPGPEPGVMHPIDQSFYDLAIKERDYERRKVDRLTDELAKLRARLREGE